VGKVVGVTGIKSSIKQAPNWSKSGLLGEEREIELELKLIADVGLIGLPNAGKSTLLSVISNARPKIAEYPFTTLSPNLGVVEFGQRELVFADIPGLIDGASSGRGLGYQFLRHIERTQILLHLISSEEADFYKAYKIIRRELGKFNKNLLKKPEIIVISKADLFSHDELKSKIKKIPQKSQSLLVISAVSHQGLDKLREKAFSIC
jgi:GTP-binding protein